jgi:hypothetical protein
VGVWALLAISTGVLKIPSPIIKLTTTIVRSKTASLGLMVVLIKIVVIDWSCYGELKALQGNPKKDTFVI